MEPQITSSAEYDQAIVDLYNEHAKAYAEVKNKPGTLFEEGFHAFVLNALNAAVSRYSVVTLKAKFHAEAITA